MMKRAFDFTVALLMLVALGLPLLVLMGLVHWKMGRPVLFRQQRPGLHGRPFGVVLKGDMSLVGPRPLLMEYLPLYSPEQARRHEVRPGITGWAQVNGRNALTWDEKFKLDVWYVDHQSLRLDLRILFLTLRRVVQRDGITAAGDASMPRFTGNNTP